MEAFEILDLAEASAALRQRARPQRRPGAGSAALAAALDGPRRLAAARALKGLLILEHALERGDLLGESTHAS